MGIIKDIKGQKFGRLLVLEQDGLKDGRNMFWVCLCDCGELKSLCANWLRTKNTRSCGCLRNDLLKEKMSGKNHYGWKGKDVKYRALHQWINKKRPLNVICQFCADNKNIQAACKNGNYTRESKDYLWLCQKCHGRYDHGWWFKNKKWHKVCNGCLKSLEVNNINFYKRKSGQWLPKCKKCSNKSLSLSPSVSRGEGRVETK